MKDATGRWTIDAEIDEDPGWGRRVRSLSGRNSAYYGCGPTEVKHFTVVNDAGLMGLVPVSAMGYNWDEFCSELFEKPGFKTDGADQNQQLAAVKGQVCSSTGMGDGTYPVEVTFERETGLAVKFEVDFYPENEDDQW